MKKVENENGDLLLSQKSLLEKIQNINKLYKIHFFSLSLFLIFSVCSSIFLIYNLLTGQIIPTLSQRYGLFGIIFNTIQLITLNLMNVFLIVQISFYYSFIIRGNRSIRNIEQIDSSEEGVQTSNNLYLGITSYINNISTFFNRYSKDKRNLSDLVSIFLFINFFFGFLIVFIFLSIIGIGDSTGLSQAFSAIFFLGMIISWLISLRTSFKIMKKISIWEKIILKLDTWANDLENLPLNANNNK